MKFGRAPATARSFIKRDIGMLSGRPAAILCDLFDAVHNLVQRLLGSDIGERSAWPFGERYFAIDFF
jgi:hypothetical protein